MSLSYDLMYNATAGIQLAFTTKTSSRLLSVNHRTKKRNQMLKIFPVNTFDTWTKENFILANLYINFTKAPSSLQSTIEFLKDVDEKEVYKFKNEIINYKDFLIQDIKRIKLEEGDNPGIDYMIQEYRNNKIKWYTFYFYLVVSGSDIEKIQRSRLNGYLIKKIKKLLLYVSFSDKSMMLIKELLKDNIKI